MPDIVGRYTLAEMRERVWRRLDALRADTVSIIGEESITLTTDALYTVPDLDIAINKALVGHYVELVGNSNKAFSDEEEIDVVTNQTEYQLPTDMVQLKGLWWKDSSITYTILPPNERTYMHQVDEGGPLDPSVANGAPTYRRQLNFIVLNEIPTVDNPKGILVRYVKWVNWLSRPDQVIETEFAQILQECVIISAALDLAWSKAKQDNPQWKTELGEWQSRLASMVRNTDNPPFVVMYYPHPFRRR